MRKSDLEYLKENHPIDYYNLTQDPNGHSSSSGTGFVLFLVVVFLIAVGYFLAKYTS